jgi:hypothetical protein
MPATRSPQCEPVPFIYAAPLSIRHLLARSQDGRHHLCGGRSIHFCEGRAHQPGHRRSELADLILGTRYLIVQRATAELSGRFQVQPLTYDRAAFAAVKESPIKPVALVHGDPFKKLVETGVSPQGYDAYIVITKAKANFGSSIRKIEGVGVINGGRPAAVFVSEEIDARNGK